MTDPAAGRSLGADGRCRIQHPFRRIPLERVRRTVHGLCAGEVSYVLGGDLLRDEPAPPPDAPAGMSVCWVRRVGDEHYPALLAICADQGLGEGWCAGELLRGSKAVCILANREGRNEPAAAGWMTHVPFPVDEIGHIFEPAEKQAYLCVCYVRPALRGLRLQRLMIQHRLAEALAEGDRWACAMTTPANPPSLRSYLAEGLRPILRVDTRGAGRWRVSVFRRIDGRQPTGTLRCQQGLEPSPHLHVARLSG